MQKKILLLICFVLFILQFVFYSCSSTPGISIDLKTQKEKREQVDVSKFLICQENFLIEQYNPDLKSSSYSSSNNSKADRTGNYIVGLLNIISLVEYFAELPDKCKFYEFDVSVSFEDISRKNYTFNRTYAVWASSKGNAKKELKKYYVVMSAASLIGLEGDYQTIKDSFELKDATTNFKAVYIIVSIVIIIVSFAIATKRRNKKINMNMKLKSQKCLV